MPLVPQYRNRLRGKSVGQLRRKQSALRAAPVIAVEGETLDADAARKKEILQRRLALAQNPGIRQRVLGKGVNTIRRAQNPQLQGPRPADLAAKAEALKARLNRALGLTQVQAGTAAAIAPVVASEATANAATPPKTLPPAEMSSRAVGSIPVANPRSMGGDRYMVAPDDWHTPRQDPEWVAAQLARVAGFEAREKAFGVQRRKINDDRHALKATDKANKDTPGYVRNDAQYAAWKRQTDDLARQREAYHRERRGARRAADEAWYTPRGLKVPY